MNELRPMPWRECLTLLRSTPVGRLVFTEDALPAIRPVNFVVRGTDIIVRTSRGGTLSKIAGEVVAFEADEVDPHTHTGWSVVAVGKAEPVTDIDELADLADPAWRPWAPGDRSHFLRIQIELVNGRRLAPAA